MDENWPLVTFVLIFINLAVFLFSQSNIDAIIENFGLAPSSLYSKPWTLITHMFIHGNIIHFTINMLMLAILGLAIEEKLGNMKFLSVYFFSGLVSILFVFLLEAMTQTVVTVIGASGAIFGLMFVAGAIAGFEQVPVILVPLLNILALPLILVKSENIKVPLFVAIAFYFILNAFFFFYYFPYSIGEFGHFGGLIGGMLALFVFKKQQFI